jgi:NTP pyrophosphatase (non-canonical NTP hydrolase)
MVKTIMRSQPTHTKGRKMLFKGYKISVRQEEEVGDLLWDMMNTANSNELYA